MCRPKNTHRLLCLESGQRKKKLVVGKKRKTITAQGNKIQPHPSLTTWKNREEKRPMERKRKEVLG